MISLVFNLDCNKHGVPSSDAIPILIADSSKNLKNSKGQRREKSKENTKDSKNIKSKKLKRKI